MSDLLKRVAIVGSGNWGSTIAKIVGTNILKFNTFENEIRMYVYEELVDGRKLTEIINQEHENIKYLPGHKFSHNVVAYADAVETVKDADILLFVLPHQFVEIICNAIKSHVKKTAFIVSFSKGFYVSQDKRVDLLSTVVSSLLEVPCYVLMGANIANEVAAGTFCEATVGSRNYEHGQIVKGLLQTDEFRIVIKPDAEVIEVLGALKNIVAVAAGFSDGLGYGDNTKAAVIRLGLKEMVKFCEEFFPGHHPHIFLESCGVADLVTTCYGGRNRKIVCIVTLALHIHHVITKDKDDIAHKIQALIPTCFLILYYTFGLVSIYRFHRVGILLFASIGIILFMAACLFFSWIIFLLVSLVLDHNIMSKMFGFFVLFGLLFGTFVTIVIATLELAFNLTKLIQMHGYTTF
ncbi:unnamed protein product [Rotaria socialis]|uniref:Glycerol-3-phosphate dehydrogenase [NAD(+)] n=1 Tax=Rotaria socialis TaxID=392032 RepID=A0A820L053_9BILA|nr:unnamed protein product [Rotaria socialis]